MAAARGFTLLEIIVALAVFAIVAVVLYRSTGDVVSQTRRLEDRTFATWVARNALAAIELERERPRQPLANGHDTREATMAGRKFDIDVQVSATSHPGLQRVEVSVRLAGFDASAPPQARLTGFLGIH